MSEQRLSDADLSPEEKIVAPHEYDGKLPVEHDEKIVAHRDTEAGPGRKAVALNLVENPLKVSYPASPLPGLLSQDLMTIMHPFIDNLNTARLSRPGIQ